MKKIIIAVIIFTLSLGIGFMVAKPLLAHGPCDDVNGDGMSSGMEYGLYHISSHTPHGPADENHNPGTHMGYSLCVGDN